MCPPWQPACTYNMPTNCPCQNGGICVALPTGNLACSCRYGYTGEKCEISKFFYLIFIYSLVVAHQKHYPPLKKKYQKFKI